MANQFNNGYRSVTDHAALVGDTAAIDFGRQLAQDFAEAVELGYIKMSDRHMSFMLGVGSAVEAIKRKGTGAA